MASGFGRTAPSFCGVFLSPDDGTNLTILSLARRSLPLAQFTGMTQASHMGRHSYVTRRSNNRPYPPWCRSKIATFYFRGSCGTLGGQLPRRRRGGSGSCCACQCRALKAGSCRWFPPFNNTYLEWSAASAGRARHHRPGRAPPGRAGPNRQDPDQASSGGWRCCTPIMRPMLVTQSERIDVRSQIRRVRSGIYQRLGT